MTGAARILGDQVGSLAPAFLAALAVHVLAGLTAVITGAVAALTVKGTRRHVRAGRWFYRAITVVFATAAILAALRWRQDYPLLIIGAVAYAAATAGYLHRRLGRPGDTGHITGMGIGYTAMLTAFYVDNGPHLPVWDHLPVLAFWLLPSAIAAPLITRAAILARRARRRRGAPGSRRQVCSTDARASSDPGSAVPGRGDGRPAGRGRGGQPASATSSPNSRPEPPAAV